jgi:hypothetical protein
MSNPMGIDRPEGCFQEEYIHRFNQMCSRALNWSITLTLCHTQRANAHTLPYGWGRSQVAACVRPVVVVGLSAATVGQRRHQCGGGDVRRLSIGGGGDAVNSAGSLCTADTRDCRTDKDMCTYTCRRYR